MALTRCNSHRSTSAAPKRTTAVALLLGVSLLTTAQAATIAVTSTAADRGTFTELQCLPPGSDVDAGPTATTVTGGATLAAAQADGGVTLREAICVANNTPEADVITLSATTYTLTGPDNHWYGPNGLPPIGDDITIEGNGAVIRRDPGAAGFRLFFVSRKTLTDGIAVRGGADRAHLVLRDLVLRNGLAKGGDGQSGGGGGGMGGAIFNQGLLDIERVTFASNHARGGNSGTGSVLSLGRGGGIGEDGFLGGGFGPGLHGGAGGGAALFDDVAPVFKYACGGGAGFGVAPGGDAQLKQEGDFPTSPRATAAVSAMSVAQIPSSVPTPATPIAREPAAMAAAVAWEMPIPAAAMVGAAVSAGVAIRPRIAAVEVALAAAAARAACRPGWKLARVALAAAAARDWSLSADRRPPRRAVLVASAAAVARATIRMATRAASAGPEVSGLAMADWQSGRPVAAAAPAWAARCSTTVAR